jgi:type II secretory pathway pseudopilin PulG
MFKNWLKNKKINNKGFSLVEIVLAVALLAFASVAIGAVIISTQNNTTHMMSEAEMQQELVEVQEAVHNEVLATNTGIRVWGSPHWNFSGYIFRPNESLCTYELLIGFYNLDYVDYSVTKKFYRYNKTEKILYVAEEQQKLDKNNTDPANPTVNLPTVLKVENGYDMMMLQKSDKWDIVATNVESFDFDLSQYEDQNLVSFTIELKKDDLSYSADDTIYLRNDIKVNEDFVIDPYIKRPENQNPLP